MKLTQKGFTIIEVILVIVLLGIIGFTGYRVYTANRDASDTLNKSDDVAGQKIADNNADNQEVVRPTPKDWKEYSDDLISLDIPETWEKGELPESEPVYEHKYGKPYDIIFVSEDFQVVTPDHGEGVIVEMRYQDTGLKFKKLLPRLPQRQLMN